MCICVSWWLSWHRVSKLAWSLCHMARLPPTFLLLSAALSEICVFSHSCGFWKPNWCDLDASSGSLGVSSVWDTPLDSQPHQHFLCSFCTPDMKQCRHYPKKPRSSPLWAHSKHSTSVILYQCELFGCMFLVFSVSSNMSC